MQSESDPQLGWFGRRWAKTAPSEKIVLIGTGAVILVAVGVSIGSSGEGSSQTNATPQTTQSYQSLNAPAAKSIPVLLPKSSMEDSFPADESSFIAILKSARDNFKSASNEMAAGGLRRSRAKAICQAITGPNVSRWLGTISTLSSNGDGKGVLAIRLADGIYVKTWNNSLSDTGSNTLIDPDSDLFDRVSRLKKGQKVIFSGRLFSAAKDCWNESSMTIEGSMTEPEFIMRFSSVIPYSD